MNLAGKSILCVRPDGLGDVFMTSAALEAIKEAFPSCVLTLLASSAGSGGLSLIPAIDRVITFNVPWEGETGDARGTPEEAFRVVEAIRKERFDAAVIFTNFSQSPLPSALLCYLAGVPKRAAFCHENPQRLLTNWYPDPEPQILVRHGVERQLQLAALLGAPSGPRRISLVVPEEARRGAQQKLFALNMNFNDRYVVVHPGCNAASRTYPRESFGAAIREIIARAGCTVILTGVEAEGTILAEIEREAGKECHAAPGMFTIPELAAVVKGSQAVLTNNTVLSHLAAGLERPVVVVYALTNPEHTPWMTKSRVLYHDVACKYCYSSPCPAGHHDCLRKVTPHAVADAVLDILDPASPHSNCLPVLPEPSKRLFSAEISLKADNLSPDI